jgi:hypothetical protein
MCANNNSGNGWKEGARDSTSTTHLREGELHVGDPGGARNLRHCLWERLEVIGRQWSVLPEVRHEGNLPICKRAQESLFLENLPPHRRRRERQRRKGHEYRRRRS